MGLYKRPSSFVREKPGDVSFSEAEKIKIIKDLQKDVLTYSDKDANWLVGVKVGEGSRRMGFVSSMRFDNQLALPLQDFCLYRESTQSRKIHFLDLIRMEN